MTKMLDTIGLKSEILFSMRDILRTEGFVEVITPVARRTDIGPGRRPRVDLDGARFLRAMIGPALRVNLEYRSRLFEIGPCFRLDTPDELHAREFSMLDLYASGESFDWLCELATRLVSPHIAYTPTRISVADYIRDLFGIDLRREPLGDLPMRMASRMKLSPATPFKAVLGRFVEHHLEIRSAAGAVFLTDYPLGGDEPCARLSPGSTATLNRFELIVDGVEVVHGYEDEIDGAAFARRARDVDLYDDEQRLVWNAIAAGRVPASSVGLGVGIERLCMVASGVKDISQFTHSAQY